MHWNHYTEGPRRYFKKTLNRLKLMSHIFRIYNFSVYIHSTENSLP